ncbi:ROK family transcriptional regulator [Phycicoccus sp.]|uniref:ROK family transcriptional regulator n=1 Tax=Phycicoccus sp. TaxID=1902410 RepID=UPI002C81C53D|nr:ROK family transcriptional regulator [Phycicoccus sp.]HMM96097.1 ROK family transcriptional regulator [Phycicoccus sp.]
MEPEKPSLDLLRQLSDRHVLGALVDEPELTRAQIATRSGLSKPTVGESVRRLLEVGALRDTGERTGGRGRAGTLYALAEDTGVALAVGVGPDGVRAEVVDVHGRVLAEAVEEVALPTTPEVLAAAIPRVAAGAASSARGTVRLAVVSAADPVDRASGALVHLPDAPFLVGDLAPVPLLAGLVVGEVAVDNDVNWAARAELAAGAPPDVAYLYLDRGLGCAVVADGQVLRGAHGLAGEVAHLVTTGPDGRAVPFTDLFAALGLREPGSTAVDTAAVLHLAGSTDAADRTRLEALAVGVAGVLAALVALADPAEVVLGGAWGSHPALVERVGEVFGRMPRHVPVRPPEVTEHPALVGARQEALRRLRELVVSGGAHG